MVVIRGVSKEGVSPKHRPKVGNGLEGTIASDASSKVQCTN